MLLEGCHVVVAPIYMPHLHIFFSCQIREATADRAGIKSWINKETEKIMGEESEVLVTDEMTV